MPGETTTAALTNSLPSMRFGARTVQEQKGTTRDTVDRVVLPKNMGNIWSEVDLAKQSAQTVTETTDLLDNPQQLSDSLRSITPADGGIHILYTDRVTERVISDTASIVRSGILGMNAIMRKLDLDIITTGRAATTDLGTAGNPLTSALVTHAKYRISSNTTEAGMGPYHMQHHGFALADIDDEFTAPLGTYEITGGESADVVKRSYTSGPRILGDVNVHENGNLSIDANTDTEGFVYAQMGIILVEGRGVRTEPLRRPNIGGGATSVFMYFEYGVGERSSGNWLFSITADATGPA